jgi:hypothetical protein
MNSKKHGTCDRVASVFTFHLSLFTFHVLLSDQ